MEQKNNFHYVQVLLDQLYGIDIEEEDLEELGLIAWELIGNKDTRTYKYRVCPDSENSIKLPCNATSIESVTTSYEDWNRVTNYSENGNNWTSFVESSIEAEKVYTSPYYASGKLIPYEQIGDTLYFTKNYGTLNVLYKGIFMDEDGLPYLSNKEALAIATYIAYVTKYKEGLKTNNANSINLANSLELKWAKQCDQARVTNLSQNDMNEILNVKGSFDRHSYGFSYKPIRV